MGGRYYIYPYIESDTFSTKSYGYYLEINGWSEPERSTDIWFIVIIVLICIAVIAFIALVVYLYIRRHLKYKEMIRVDDDEIIENM